jgi:hypothetical protein
MPLGYLIFPRDPHRTTIKQSAALKMRVGAISSLDCPWRRHKVQPTALREEKHLGLKPFSTLPPPGQRAASRGGGEEKNLRSPKSRIRTPANRAGEKSILQQNLSLKMMGLLFSAR